MKLTGIHIKNFKAIHEMKIDSIENALILVGQNNTGKTTILEAIRAAFGDYHISAEDFDGDCANIEMDLSLEFSIEDLKWLHQNGIVSQYKSFAVSNASSSAGVFFSIRPIHEKQCPHFFA